MMKHKGPSSTARQLEFSLTLGKPRRARTVPRDTGIRFNVLKACALLWCLGLCARLYVLQISDATAWRTWAARQHTASIQVATPRGNIIDRLGRPLAVSVPAGSVFARPKQIKDPQRVARALAPILSVPEKNLVKSLKDSSRPFLWLARQQPRAVVDRALTLGFTGIGSIDEMKRAYPYGEGAGPLIGKANIDGVGLSGVELQFDRMLRGRKDAASIRRDALGNVIDVTEVSLDRGVSDEPPSLQLTIDGAIQAIVDEELERGRIDAKARGAIAILVDARTGDLLALSQSPSININSPIADPKLLTNRAVEAVFEPGSIMKPLIAGLALDRGLTRESELIDCEGGSFRFGGRTINDVHPEKVISLRDIIVRSSNIGIAKIGMRLGAERLYDGLRLLGFGNDTRLGLPGESDGILRSVENWSKVDIATHSFGQGIAVTAPQLARAMAAVVNDGILPQLRVVRGEREGEGIRVFTKQTSAVIRDMMEAVVIDEHGTGARAAIPGVIIGGKTGTAQKAREDGRGYAQGKYVSGFAGFADASAIEIDTKLALMVAVDEPSTSIYGGVVAAPVFRRIIQRVLHHLATEQHLDAASRNGNVFTIAHQGSRAYREQKL